MNNGDKDFEEYLDGKSVISEKYAKLRDVDPPEDLDAAILAEAERVAKIHSRPAGARRWMVPVSLAATVMICFSLVLNVLREAPSGIDADQALDAIIPGDSFEESSPALSVQSMGRSPEGAKEGALAKREYFVRQGEAESVLIKPSTSDSRSNEDKNEKQRYDDAIAGRVAGRPAPATAAPPVEALQERPAPVVAQNLPEIPLMAADELMVLGQMMEIVTDYLQALSAVQKELRDDSQSPVEAQSLAVLETGKSSDAVLSSFSAEKKSDHPVPEQARTDEPDARLRRIVELHTQSQNIAAAQALDEFRQAFTDHPVSHLLLERGY